MKFGNFAAVGVLVVSTFSVSRAQSGKIDVYTTEQLSASAAAKVKPSSKAGDPPGVLEHYPNHYTMLITRHEDGQSELHEHVADVFFVTEGEAQLWTGGKMLNAKVTNPGERRGSGLAGASSVVLKLGDVVHIPANVPHQLRVASGRFTYFVVKVQEDGPATTSTAESR